MHLWRPAELRSTSLGYPGWSLVLRAPQLNTNLLDAGRVECGKYASQPLLKSSLSTHPRGLPKDGPPHSIYTFRTPCVCLQRRVAISRGNRSGSSRRRLITGWPFHVIDEQHFDWAFGRFESKPQLFLECVKAFAGEKGGTFGRHYIKISLPLKGTLQMIPSATAQSHRLAGSFSTWIL
jgi:hypothetical protein